MVDVETKPFQMPNDLTVIAIGGCGKRLVNHLCDHEWFFRHFLSENKTLSIYIMDTDTNQRPQDLQIEKARRTQIFNLQKSQEGFGGKIEYAYYYLPDLAQVEQPTALTSSDVIAQIKSRRVRPEVKLWWMNDPPAWSYENLKKIDPNIVNDFGGGVHRRRAISKAVFYKAITQSAGKFPSFQGSGDTAIVVGLGGGTGAGMVIDLARYIHDRKGAHSKIWLFAVLPSNDESPNEQLNAAIALFELEYLNLTEDKLFNFIVLSSLGPTGYKPGLDNKKEVIDFDNAFPYLLINAFYLPHSDIADIIDAKKDYSGFIVGDAHVIEYPIEELKNLKTEFESIIKELEDIRINREKSIGIVDELLNRILVQFPGQVRKPDEVAVTTTDILLVRKEIERLRRLWDNEMASLLRYKTPEEINSFIRNNMPADLRVLEKIDLYDKLTEYVEKISSFMRVENKRLENEADKTLYVKIRDSLDLIESFAKIQKRILGIEEEAARNALLKIARSDVDFAQILGEINQRKATIRGELVEIQKKEKEKSEEFENLKEETRKIEGQVSVVCNEETPLIGYYTENRNKFQAIQKNEALFIEKFASMSNTVSREHARTSDAQPPAYNRKKWLEMARVSEIEAVIDRLPDDAISTEYRDILKKLPGSYAEYYYYDFRYEIEKKPRSILGKIATGAGRAADKLTGEPSTLEQYQKKRSIAREYLERISRQSKGTIQLHTPMQIDFKTGFLSDAARQKTEDMRNRIEGDLAKKLELSEEDVKLLAPAFEKSDEDGIRTGFKKILGDILLSRNAISEKTLKKEQERNELVRSETGLQNSLSFYAAIDGVIEDTIPFRREYTLHLGLFEQGLRKVDEKKKTGIETIRGLFRSRLGEINPRVLSLVDERLTSDMGALDGSEEGLREVTRLINLVHQKSKDIVKAEMLGLNKFVIEYGNNNWCLDKAALVIASTSHAISSHIVNEADNIRRPLSINTLSLRSLNDLAVVSHNYTRPWDVAITFFGSATFLENIAPLISGQGYWEKYDRYRNNLLHHVLFLQDGKYLERTDLLKDVEAAEKANMERFGKEEQRREAVNEILRLYKVKDLNEAVKR
ncbi:MAG TPA: tubulin-like doman-containing protein [Methanomicrobiales archaeon]|nr:tubulin-like doman-containing protein [Methanomicrobiales archaeon]